MRSYTKTVYEGERVGDIDYSFPFAASNCYNCERTEESRAELIQRHVDLLLEIERRLAAGESLQVQTGGGYWHDVLSIGMYDGWPFWKPTPAVQRRDHVLGGAVWDFWYEIHGVRAS
jgi:hypothetical protein